MNKQLLLIFIFLTMLLNAVLHAKQVEYLEILGKEKEFLSRWEISKHNNEQIISGNTLLDEIVVKTINGTTIEWINKRKHKNKTFTATRTNKTITIIGKENNNPINKTINVSNFPWFQTPGFLLKPFILSDKETIQFLFLRIKSLTPILLEVKKIKEETLILNNKKHIAIKTELYPPNFLKYFWKATMWFDKKTGNVLKYDGLISGPGSDSFQIIYSK